MLALLQVKEGAANTEYGTDYTKWDMWCPEDEEDDLINSCTPNNPAFRAMEKDINERHERWAMSISSRWHAPSASAWALPAGGLESSSLLEKGVVKKGNGMDSASGWLPYPLMRQTHPTMPPTFRMVEQRQIAERQRVAGNEAFKAGQYSEALRCYQLGLEAQKTNMALHANAAQAALKLSCFVQAIEHCDKVGPQWGLGTQWPWVRTFYSAALLQNLKCRGSSGPAC